MSKKVLNQEVLNNERYIRIAKNLVDGPIVIGYDGLADLHRHYDEIVVLMQKEASEHRKVRSEKGLDELTQQEKDEHRQAVKQRVIADLDRWIARREWRDNDGQGSYPR